MKAAIISFLLKKNDYLKNHERAASTALQIFRKEGRTTDWYRVFLNKNDCQVSEIKSVDDFRLKVPLLSKELVFGENNFDELLKCSTREIQSIMLSSGYSGLFSMGVITLSEHRKLAVQTDLFLEIFFGIKKGEALIINASAMGVRAFTNHTCCDTGPRSDIVVALLKEVSLHYDKTIVTADPHLIKQIAEESIAAGIDWANRKVWFISGGDWFPETLRGYVHGLIGKSAFVPENGFWAAIFGLTELGYPLLFETAQMAMLRSELASNRSLIDYRFKYRQGRNTTPFVFHHLQSAFYVEHVGDESCVPELVFTTLDRKRAVPLIRYNTHDVGELLNSAVFGNIKFPFPMVAFWGRNQKGIQLSLSELTINDIKEFLFSDYELAAKITGFFTLLHVDGKVVLNIQLKKGALLSEKENESFAFQFYQFFPSVVTVFFSLYHKLEQQMELDFERKFNHLIEHHHG